ncbi:MAG: ATP-dependent RecD-like DNA helicase [Lactobacillus sp.]|nr:ATP-dependent RecD-like DNA helicase [Lactobacillus sp.]
MNQIELIGKVNSIVFENDQDLFKIIDVDLINKLPDYDRENIRVTGNFGDLQFGSSYKFVGNLVIHPKFGPQFKATRYEQLLPHEEESLTKYLSSDKFPGIGKKTAEKIVADLGPDALDALKENPHQIDNLDLTNKQKDSLLSGISQMDSLSEVVLKLAKFGIKKNVATAIYKTFHGEALEKIKEDPYNLIGEIRGYGFKTADEIGEGLGIEPYDSRRIKGAVFQILQNALIQEGDTFVKLAELLTQAGELLSINEYDPIATAVNELQKQGKIIVDGENAALQRIYQVEQDIAQELKRIINTRPKTTKFTDDEIEIAIKNAEKSLKIKYDDTQKLAIKNAVNNPITILTGGPGTGKTTIINGIILCLQELENIPATSIYSDDPPILLAAPTGRAAKRMSEITGITAKTVHRLLGLGIGENEDTELNELNGDILIVDEMSMIDMFLFRLLVKGIDATKHIVFVGDQNQLPSVGAGNVYHDLIVSNAFPTTRLTTIHRQGEDSSIIKLAHAINEDETEAESIIFNKTNNYSFIECQPNLVGPAIEQIVNFALKRGFKKDDIQVLGAMYNGVGGINNLNDLIQKIINPPKVDQSKRKELRAHNEVFYIGDRILQLQNNPEKDIFNGQIGRIIGINEDNNNECLIADFDGREVKFALKDLSDITRAYAITVHKSQGSEFPLVILNLTMQNYMMLRRNFLYTAITRAEQNLVMVGEKRAYEMALRTPGNNRQTNLAPKIQFALNIKPFKQSIKEKNEEEVSTENTLKTSESKQTELALDVGQEQQEEEESKEYILTPELIYSGKIDPMIGMENIRPKSN